MTEAEKSERERGLSLNTHNYCRIDVKTHTAMGGQIFFFSVHAAHKMMMFFYESLQMVKGTAAVAQTEERMKQNLLL